MFVSSSEGVATVCDGDNAAQLFQSCVLHGLLGCRCPVVALSQGEGEFTFLPTTVVLHAPLLTAAIPVFFATPNEQESPVEEPTECEITRAR